MTRKLSMFLFLVLFTQVFVLAQQKMILRPDNTLEKVTNFVQDAQATINPKNKSAVQNHAIQTSKFLKSINGTIDTLRINDGSFNTPFLYYGQDWLMQWYEAPADLLIKQVGYSTVENVPGVGVEIKIVKVNYTKAQLQAAGITNWGVYEAPGNGFNNITAFPTNPDTATSGDWIPTKAGATSPFADADIWSDGGSGAPSTPEAQNSLGYQWVSMSLIAEPEIKAGEIFGIAIKNINPDMTNNQTTHALTIYAGTPTTMGAWKFYASGRTTGDLTTAGWWSREYSWDMIAEVELTGDRAPVIAGLTSLGTTLSEAGRQVSATITDDNPSGGSFGVQSAVLQYSIDGGTTYVDVAMVSSGNTYTGSIDGQPAGTTVRYKVTATDVNNNVTTSSVKSYKVFKKANDVLLVYNSGDFTANTSRALYVGYGANSYITDPVANDVWYVSTDGSSLVGDVLALYDNVIQIDGSFPKSDLSSKIDTWLKSATASNKKAYLLSSQDYGCYITGNCADTTFAAGTMQYDFLGVETLGPQDFSASVTAPMSVTPVANDPISGWVNKYNTDSSTTFWFDPSFELAAAFSNYADNIKPNASAKVAFTSGTNNVGIYNEGTNWKTAFLTFDYAGCNFRSDTSLTQATDPKYAWGITVGNQALKFLTWAGYVVDVNEQISGPATYQLAQNYPNPFNPSTKLNYAIEKPGLVTLKVFDVLGREVAALVNEVQNAGSHSVSFDASKLASGMYLYTMTSGNFTSTKKMMLLK